MNTITPAALKRLERHGIPEWLAHRLFNELSVQEANERVSFLNRLYSPKSLPKTISYAPSGSSVEHLGLRPYQLEALRRVLPSPGVANSGLLQVPCGGGKTLLAAAILKELGMPGVFLTVSNTACDQVCQTLRAAGVHDVFVINSSNKIKVLPHVFVTTYNMLSTRLEGPNQLAIQTMLSIKHGIVIFDEVHVLPAKCFQYVNRLYRQLTVGLTATLYREDGNVDQIKRMSGPVLFRITPSQLANQGFMSRIECVEVPLAETHASRKLVALGYLVRHHLAKGDRILVFSDRVQRLHAAHEFLTEILRLHVPAPIVFETPDSERRRLFDGFCSGAHRVLLLGKVGNTAIDLPPANVGINLGLEDGSRVQTLQQVGRLQRLRDDPTGLMYFLVQHAREADFFARRRHALENEGYACTTRSELPMPLSATELERTLGRLDELLEPIAKKC